MEKPLKLLVLYHTALLREVENAIIISHSARISHKKFYTVDKTDFLYQSTIILRQYKKYLEIWLDVFDAHDRSS